MKQTLLLMSAMLIATAADAATIFGSRSAFQSAIGSYTNLDFEGLAAPASTAYFGTTGYTASGLTITSTQSQLWAISSTNSLTTVFEAGLGSGDYMEGSYTSTCCGIGNTVFTLPSGTMAFGLDFRSYNQMAGLAGIMGSFHFDFLTTAGHVHFNEGGASVLFFGYLADNPILSVTITGNGDQPSNSQFFHFDNVTFNTTAENSETPELSTAALTTTALFIPLLRLFYSRKRNILFNAL